MLQYRRGGNATTETKPFTKTQIYYSKILVKGLTIIADEVAHAGFGVGISVNGLDRLVKADSVFKDLRQRADEMHNATVNIDTHLNNRDQVDGFFNDVRKLHHVSSNVDVHMHGTQAMNDEMKRYATRINKNVDLKLLNADRVNHEMDVLDRPAHKRIRFNVDTGEVMNIRNSMNQTNSDLDRITRNVHRFNNSLTSTGRVSSGSFNHLNRSIASANANAGRLANTGHRIHGVFSGAVLGNAFSNVFSTFTTHAESAIKSGFQLVKVGQEADESWRHIGLNRANSNDMVKQMDNLRDNAGMDETAIQRMQKAFYTFTGSAPRARTLVNEVTDFGKASGESNQEIARMGTMLPRMLSAGKIRGQMFNRTFGQSGKLVNALAKASGHSASSFRQLVDSGRMTSQQLQQYMWKASKGSSSALREYTRTFGGQMTVIKGMWTGAEEKFSHPFVNQLTVSLNRTEKSAGGLNRVQKSVQQLAGTLGHKFGNQVGKAIGWIARNQKPLIRTGTAMARILKEMASGAWHEFSGVLTLIGGHAGHSSHSLNGVSNALTAISRHTGAMRTLGKVFLTTFAIEKVVKFKRALIGVNGHVGVLRRLTHALINPQETVLKLQERWMTVQKLWTSIIGPIKAFWTAEKAGVGIQTALNVAMDANPVGAVVVGLTAAVGAITGVVVGLHHLYVHSATARHGMQAIGRVGVRAFKAITFPERMVIKFAGGIAKSVWNASAGIRHRLAGAFDNAENHARRFYHSSMYNARKWGRETGNWITGNGWRYRHNQSSNSRSTAVAHRRIDSYRRNSSHKFRAYIASNGRIYRRYHKGTTRISETTYKQREALRQRYYRRYYDSLKKYEHNYKAYENKRSSLSRKYGKLRAMYSAKSLALIEKRFDKLRKTIVRYAKRMYHDTQRIFRHIGTGASKQFKGIYRSVRKYLRMSNTEAKKDFRTLYRNSRKWLNGSINKYVRSLRYRYRKQRYYDRQLVKQSRLTGKAMYHLPLGWIKRETKDLIRNWRRQRRSYVTHNRRMTHAERAHLSTMSEHLRTFRDRFESLMNHLEDNIYDSWSKFWTKMKNRTGSGINEVQRPLNTGAMHINSFVRAFGETSSPMREMPEVSYATGTGELRRPITQMVNATLNDGIDSPETGNQETVIKPTGQIEFPKGRNIQETLEPGTEVLNATETRLMGEMAHFAPNIHLSTGTGSHVERTIERQLSNATDNSIINNYSNPISTPSVPEVTVNPIIKTEPQVHVNTDSVNPGNTSRIVNHTVTNLIKRISPVTNESLPQVHFANGTGIFGSIFSRMSGWLRNAINGDNSGMSYDSVWNQAKGRGYHKLLHVLQKVLSHSEQILSGFMGNAPTGYHGVLNDITKGIYGQTTNQVDSWWRALMNLTNQTLNDSGSDSPLLNFAEKFGQGKRYIYGATGQGGAYDCSGFVQAVLRHYGINVPRTSGAQINSFPHISRSQAHAGDLVGNGGHIGIVADNGARNYYSAFSPSEGIRMFPLTSTYWDGGPMTFARIPKLNKLNGGSQLQLKGASKGLLGFVKRQESPMLKWIAKHLAPLLDANPGGYGVARWRPYVEKALKANGFSANSSQVNAWMHVIARESNGNPHAVNNWDSNAKAGTPSEGLVQTIGPTFKANAFPGHTNIFSGYDDLLAGIHYMAEKYGRGESAFARVSGPEGYAKGGHFHAGELMTVGERGEELMKPDFSGTVIPHNESKRILNRNNNSHPVKVEQHNKFVINGNETDMKRKVVSALDNANDDLADKLAGLFGFNEGGINI